MSFVAPAAASVPACTHPSAATTARPLMSCGIHALSERLDADAAHGLQEFLAFLASLDVDIKDARDGLGHLGLRHRRPDHLAERGDATGRTTDGDLVPLQAVLVDAEDADVPDVMVAAGIHA